MKAILVKELSVKTSRLPLQITVDGSHVRPRQARDTHILLMSRT